MGEDERFTQSPGGAPSFFFQDGTVHLTGDLRPHGTFGATSAGGNQIPIREARADQEMSHHRLHLGKSSSTMDDGMNQQY